MYHTKHLAKLYYYLRPLRATFGPKANVHTMSSKQRSNQDDKKLSTDVTTSEAALRCVTVNLIGSRLRWPGRLVGADTVCPRL